MTATGSTATGLDLAAGFPAATRDDWEALADGVVGRSGPLPPGGAVEKLTTTTFDGIRVRPLYTADDVRSGPGALPRGRAPGGWDVRQRHTGAEPAAARLAVLADLENGANSVWLAVGRDGVPVDGLGEAVADVLLDMAPVVLDAGVDAERAAEAYLACADARGVVPAELLGNLGLDPIGVRARSGHGPDVSSVVPLAWRVATGLPRVRAVVVDALPVHEAGASDAQELGFSLASGVAYLRTLVEAGLDLRTAARLLEFRYAATVEQFPTIAKLRAARLLWSRVTRACGAAQPQFQHAVGSPVMLSRRDPYVNLLRGTVAGFGAGVGGADAVTVLPFDATLRIPDDFSRRIARNTQTVLIEEAHLARVADPAGGSWYVERLTAELARAGWAFFQGIEAAGGAVAALDAGFLADEVAAVRERRLADLATRRTPVTGVSEFPHLAEPALGGAPSSDDRSSAGGLPVFRLAAPFEDYRDRSDAQRAATGARPRAFLATLGPVAAHTARASFARNLLHAGGVETVELGPVTGAGQAAELFATADAGVAVLCGSDTTYTEIAAEVVAALRSAGARLVLLAGRSDVPGLDGHLYAGCDALAVIECVHTAVRDFTRQEATT